MTEQELITKQQLEIEDLKIIMREAYKVIEDIRMSMICIGGPLNDNILGFNREQKNYLHRNVLSGCETMYWGFMEKELSDD